MISTETKYVVDSQRMPDYIRIVRRRETVLLGIINLIIMSFLSIHVYHLGGNDFQFFWAVAVAAAFSFGLGYLIPKKREYNELKGLGGLEFSMTHDSIMQLRSGTIEKEFKFEEIAFVTKTLAGTLIIKGSKLNYLGNQSKIGREYAIFIPMITSNYLELIELLKSRRKKR